MNPVNLKYTRYVNSVNYVNPMNYMKPPVYEYSRCANHSTYITSTLILFMIMVVLPMTYKIVSVFDKCFTSIYYLTKQLDKLKRQYKSNKIICFKLRNKLKLLESTILSENNYSESSDFATLFSVKKCNKDAILLKRANANDAGYDLYAIDDVKIEAHGQELIGTGLCVEIPHGYYGQIQSRSSLAVKYRVSHEGGVIDSGYRGEVKVILHNMSNESFDIKKGNKIAQLILIKITTPNVIEVSKLSLSERGIGGFGSSGKS